MEKTREEEQAVINESVTWDSDTDIENPLNWPNWRKWTNVALISMQATLSPIASTILAIGAEAIASDFHLTDAYTPALPTGLYVLGLGLGPLVLGPCSELYGRRIIYLCSFTIFTILNVGCALSPNITALSILRLLSGVAGSAGPSLGASSVGDMFRVEERGRAQSAYSFGPVMGPVLGGVIGGFIVDRTHGWPWLLWTVTIASGVTTAFSAVFLKETYAPYLLSRKAARLSKINRDTNLRVEGEKHAKDLFSRAITRPIRLLFTSPICAFMSIYLSLIYGILYLHLITILLLFGPNEMYGLYSYHWTGGKTGLAYLGAGVGSLIGMVITGKFMNSSFASALARQQQRTGSSIPTPELRLPFMQVGMTIVPLGLIMFGWSAGRTHWIVPLLGACIFGTGMLMGYVCIHTYLVDCFGKWAASALAAAIVTRCAITCAFCIVGFQLYRKLGYDWGSMLLAFLCIAMIPIPFVLQRYGPRLRERQITF
ncbi:major facilitator superfamily domain-containing protein [Hypoxylon trugodes]|uniref:major facilitator superfamily domain-containing protein n=1 Tax=Hypoxylon trugodes TaxID=326681 RepID=UPI0021A076CE|nr:major facilitator superfamily domain-containing protein [Hypoxylon trugodes]KAI1386454.1 major facilitator superfamily domain-containing protein [Hypoxylon trugodes]